MSHRFGLPDAITPVSAYVITWPSPRVGGPQTLVGSLIQDLPFLFDPIGKAQFPSKVLPGGSGPALCWRDPPPSVFPETHSISSRGPSLIPPMRKRFSATPESSSRGRSATLEVLSSLRGTASPRHQALTPATGRQGWRL
jgi:hypothetical protein